MKCPICCKEMDIINQGPLYQVNMCDDINCPMYDEPVSSQNEEYQAKQVVVPM